MSAPATMSPPGVDVAAAAALREAVASGGVVILSGAGLSTESGIPDYRGPTGLRRRASPMTYSTFVGDSAARRRYWARSHLGWPAISGAMPNAGHRAVAELQGAGLLDGVITQNVDGLHQRAGAADVVELHGGLDRVVCLRCGVREQRSELATRMTAANPTFDPAVVAVNPDGDAELRDDELDRFRPPSCTCCDSDLLKPDVVFFGENVPKERVADCFALVDRCRLLLVLGSSLTVMSGFRFARRVAAAGTPLALVNEGPTRADELADIRVEAALGQTLSALVSSLGLTSAAGNRSQSS